MAWNSIYAEEIRLTCKWCDREQWVEYRTAEMGVISSRLLFRDGYICQEIQEDGHLLLTIKYSRREAIQTMQEFSKISSRLGRAVQPKDAQNHGQEENQQEKTSTAA